MTSGYKNSFYVCRSILLINGLLGSIGAKGGHPIANKPGDVGPSSAARLLRRMVER